MTTPFIEDNDQTRARREHLESIRDLVGNAYPNKFHRTNVTASAEGEDTITSIVGEFRGRAPQTEAGARPTPEQLEEANAKLKESGTVRVSGRVATPPRVMGKAAFVHLSDGRERLQIYVRRQDAVAVSNDSGQPVEQNESGWALFQLLDHGDFVGVEGFLFVTRSGELSVHVEKIQFLSKALLPMPDKVHGINDPEIRQRQRYADLIASSLKVEKDDEHAEGTDAPARELTTREVFERRSKLIREMRRHLDEHGYIEVETPMLSPIASGAAARPFRTHHNALDIDLYLRIAPELYLKRLVVGGFERVYELNRNFRNEGISTRHNPEFTMLEFYCAYMDADGMMDFCEELLKKTIETINGSLQARFENEVIDFSKFERLTMKAAIAKYWPPEISQLTGERFGVAWLDEPKRTRALERTFQEIHEATIAPTPSFRDEGPYVASDLFKEMFQEILARETLAAEPDEIETAQHITTLFERIAEKQLSQPTFITDFPKPISPLSKASPDDPTIAERFELYIAGMECANGFSELNDPEEQYQRFEEQTRQRERGDDEAMQMDEDYVKALSYGMPPAAGIGIGIDRITMLLTNRRSIRDVILFPHMRPETKMKFVNLDDRTRKFMLDEVTLDASTGTLLRSYNLKRLSDIGRRDYEALLKEAIEKYDYIWLANQLRADGRMLTEEKRTKGGKETIVKVPITAPDMVGEGEFNKFYIRGLCRRAIEDDISTLIIYRAKEVKKPRPESEARVGESVDPRKLLEDLRANSEGETALGVPGGPNSGLCVMIPKSAT